MICFMDRAFCFSPGCVNACGRKLTPELQKRGEKWWGGKDFPVSGRNFCDNEGVPLEKED